MTGHTPLEVGTHAAHDQAIQQLLAGLNATQTVFPGTGLTLVFKLGSS